MARYPSNFNDNFPLSYDTVIERQSVQDHVGSNGVPNLNQTTEPIGDMFKAIGMLEVEIESLKRPLLHTSLPVDVATTAVLPGTVVYDNGTNGVGATLSVTDESIGDIDGYTIAVGHRILVKNQVNAKHNGIYVATIVDAGAYTLTRATDADSGTTSELSSGFNVIIRSGTLGGKRMFICTTQTSIAMGLTDITFAEYLTQNQLPIGDESTVLSARVATTALLPSTGVIAYSNGTAGVGATLTRAENGALGTIDGVTLAVGDRILYKNSNDYIVKTAVANATTAALPSTGAIVYNNGTAGVGATLTRGENGVLGAIDGITNIVGDRILVKNQATAAQNGIYVVTNVGSGGAPYILTRATDLDQSAEFLYNVAVSVTGGSTNAGRQYKNTSAATPTLGSTAISFGQITPVGTSQSGIYTVTDLGNAGAEWVLTRTTDSDQAADYAAGLSVKIESGSTNGSKWFKNTNESAVVMGTTSITWEEFESANGSRPFANNAVFPVNERTYFVNVYGNKLKQIQNDAIELARKIKKMQVYMSQYTGTAGDQTPQANIYPSSKNRGY